MEMIIAIIEAATTPMASVRNAEYAIDSADCTTDTGTHRAANQTADRAGNTIAFRCALLGATDDALGMARMRNREQRERQCRSSKVKPGGRNGRQCRRLDFSLGLHLNSSGATARGRRDGNI